MFTKPLSPLSGLLLVCAITGCMRSAPDPGTPIAGSQVAQHVLSCRADNMPAMSRTRCVQVDVQSESKTVR